MRSERMPLVAGLLAMLGCDGRSTHEPAQHAPVTIDSRDRLVVGDQPLRGYGVNPRGEVTGAPSELTLPRARQAAPSLNAWLAVTVDAQSPVQAFDEAAPEQTSAFSVPLAVHDGRGVAHAVRVFVSRTASHRWEWHALANAPEVLNSASGAHAVIASGTLSFSDSGALSGQTSVTSLSFVNGPSNQLVAFDFEGAAESDGFSARTAADGAAPGLLTSWRVDADGFVHAAYGAEAPTVVAIAAPGAGAPVACDALTSR